MTAIATLHQAHIEAQRAAETYRERHVDLIKSAEPLRRAANAALRVFERDPTEESAAAYMAAYKLVDAADQKIATARAEMNDAFQVERNAFAPYDAARRLLQAAAELRTHHHDPLLILGEQ